MVELLQHEIEDVKRGIKEQWCYNNGLQGVVTFIHLDKIQYFVTSIGFEPWTSDPSQIIAFVPYQLSCRALGVNCLINPFIADSIS